MKPIKVLSLLAILLITVAPLALAEKDEPSERTLVGSWQFTVSPIKGDPNQFAPYPGLVNLSSDNTLIESDGSSLVPTPAGVVIPSAIYTSGGYGVWRAVGARKFELVAVQIGVSDADSTLVGKNTLRFAVTLSKDGKSFSGRGSNEITDANGKPVPSLSGNEQISGHRIEIAAGNPGEP